MYTQQRAIIDLIKSALICEKVQLPKDMDLETAYKVAELHGITAIVYQGAYNCGITSNSEIMTKLFMRTCEYVNYSQRQGFVLSKLLNAFDENSIDYLPLKGITIKKLYPKPEMRVMSDADILVNLSQYTKIKRVMSEIGFKESRVTDHELQWIHPALYVELHSKLIPSYNEDYYAYFGDGWKLASKIENSSRFTMTREDEFIYIFTHFAKHYRDAGIGIKHILDIWLYKKNYLDLDEKYIITELKKLQLDKFYANVLDTLEVWFNNKQENEKTELITQTIFNSGAAGTYESAVLSSAVKTRNKEKNKKTVRFTMVKKTVFKPYKEMCEKYKNLKKLPLLLPFYWVLNIIDYFKRKSLLMGFKQLKIMSKKNIDNYQNALNFVGLDFNFKE